MPDDKVERTLKHLPKSNVLVQGHRLEVDLLLSTIAEALGKKDDEVLVVDLNSVDADELTHIVGTKASLPVRLAGAVKIAYHEETGDNVYADLEANQALLLHCQAVLKADIFTQIVLFVNCSELTHEDLPKLEAIFDNADLAATIVVVADDTECDAAIIDFLLTSNKFKNVNV